MKVSESDINEALEILQKAYPHEARYDIWCCAGQEKPYVAFLNSNSALGLQSESCHGMTAVEAARGLIAEARERDPNKLRDRRIAELRQELAKLEAQSAVTTESVQA